MEEKKNHPDLSLPYPSSIWLTVNQTQLEARQEGILISALSVSLPGHKAGQGTIETGSGGMETGRHGDNQHRHTYPSDETIPGGYA